MESYSALRSGTIAGTVLSALPNLTSEDILRTVLLGMVGALASFIVTLLLRILTAGSKKKK